jgi:CheY-like chemotaxis protein
VQSPQSLQSLQSDVQHSVLIISPMADATQAAASLATSLACSVMVAATHRAALTALRHHDYSVVVVDDCMAEANPATAQLLWQSFGMAVPVQINFAFSGGSRLAREVQAAIGRREQQHVIALRAAASVLENDLKTALTGLLLQSQLALAEPALSPKLTGKLELVAELAGSMRRRLEQAQSSPVASRPV